MLFRLSDTKKPSGRNNRKSFRLLCIVLLMTACAASPSPKAIHSKNCLDIIPENVPGLKIESGPRTKAGIIRDMVSPICNGYALFNNMQSKDKSIRSGTVIFRVEVEYTGEVVSVRIENSEITSMEFLEKASKLIHNTDFVFWIKDDVNTVFLYPVHFGK
ncbi:MAG: hypothetical protein ABIK15_20135 [Pseudomonadota bacterium]